MATATVTWSAISPPFPIRNWVCGDSTMAGLSRNYTPYDVNGVQFGTGNVRVDYLQGWPSHLPDKKRAYNQAIPGHYTWEVENDLFGTQTGFARASSAGGGFTGPQPDQYHKQRKPDRLIITTGANEIINGANGSLPNPPWNSGTRAGYYQYWHASLIYQLLQQGFVPYVPTRTVGDGIHDFIITGVYPFVQSALGGGMTNAARGDRATANGNFATNFGLIGNLAADGTLSGGNFGILNSYSFTGGPTITNLDCSAMKCMLNVDAVLQGSAGAGYLGTEYNTTTDNGFGVHLNILGEITLAAAMSQFFLAAP